MRYTLYTIHHLNTLPLTDYLLVKVPVPILMLVEQSVRSSLSLVQLSPLLFAPPPGLSVPLLLQAFHIPIPPLCRSMWCVGPVEVWSLRWPFHLAITYAEVMNSSPVPRNRVPLCFRRSQGVMNDRHVGWVLSWCKQFQCPLPTMHSLIHSMCV